MNMSPGTLNLLRAILTSQQLNVGAVDFLDTAKQAAAALVELDQAIAEATKTPNPKDIH